MFPKLKLCLSALILSSSVMGGLPLRNDLLEERIQANRMFAREVLAPPQSPPRVIYIDDDNSPYLVTYDNGTYGGEGLWFAVAFLLSLYFWAGVIAFFMNSRNPFIYLTVFLLSVFLIWDVYEKYKK